MLGGSAFADRVRIMREHGNLDDSVTDADLFAECERQLVTRVAGVRPVTPVVEILRQAHGRVPLALATGSTTPVATAVLTAIELADVFDDAPVKPADELLTTRLSLRRPAPGDAACWGDGIATEAARAVVRWAAPLGEPVVARVRPANVASQRVAERAGLTRAEHLDEDGQDGPDWLYTLA